MLTVKCAKCKKPVFRYIKTCEGRLLRCYKSRIVKDFSVRQGNEVRCQRCGNLIGIDEGRWIKLKQGSFITSGTIG